MTTKPLISVVVLSYNRPTYLTRALESIDSQSLRGIEVIVVDNRSAASEEIAALVSRRFPSARLIRHDGNLGFTGGMNAGIAACRGRYVYLTEDDIELAPDCLEILSDYVAAHAEVGLAGPVMLNRASGTIRCAGGHFDLGAIYRLTILGAGEVVSEARVASPYAVTYLPGSMMMARRALLADLGGFRDEFFMYEEDVEFCARVLKRGLSIGVVPRARVLHDEPEPGVASRLEFHKIKNLSAVYFMHAPMRVLPAFVLRYGVLGLARAWARGRTGAHVQAWLWAVWHAPRLLAQRDKSRSGKLAGPPGSRL